MFIYPKIYRKLRRGPQVILPKDIGIILSYTGANKESVCVDAGTGSGWLALSLARVCKRVYSYDLREEFTRIAERNKELLGLDNIVFKNGDVLRGVDEKDVDIFTLDLPNAEKAVKTVKRALKSDGIVTAYLPHTEQMKAFVMKLDRMGFYDVHAVEVIVREMLVRKEGVRPSTKGLWHTAYLVFARKGSGVSSTAEKPVKA